MVPKSVCKSFLKFPLFLLLHSVHLVDKTSTFQYILLHFVAFYELGIYTPLHFYTPVEDETRNMGSPMAGGRRPVLCLEYNLSSLGLIDLKLGICVCCNNTEGSTKEP